MIQSPQRHGFAAALTPISSHRRTISPRGKRASLLLVISFLLVRIGVAQTDPVTEWNAIMQTTVASSNVLIQTRAAAIMQLAVFEAVNTIVGDYEPYLGTITAPTGASPEAAAIAAAYRTLVTLYPDSAASLDAARAASLSALPDGPAKDDGIAVGEAAAEALLALRASDGADAVVPYEPGTNPGEWQPTPPAYAPAFAPGWGQVTPFGIKHGAQFRPNPPPAISTGKYARHFNEVKELGDVNNTKRPQDRTDVARFYAVVLAIPPWNGGARQVSEAQGKTLSENARGFALLAMAIFDGLASSMEAKYHYNYWRPVTAIQAGATDGNRRTDPDPDWLPLVPTPPFPSYPSNHASIGAAARAVLEHLYGKAGHTVTLTSPLVPGVDLNYTSWEQITDDIDDARIYGGIHYRFDQQAGARLGRRVGSYILKHHLRPVSDRKEVSMTTEAATSSLNKNVPTAYAIHQNYPNPFNPSTEIHFDLPEASAVRLVVYDLLGREVALLLDRELSAGSHQLRWNAEGLPSGMYLYRITAGSFTASRTMLLLK